MTNAEKNALTSGLDDLIRRAAPKVATVSKYGGVLYTIRPEEKEGQFCGVFVYKNHVQISFANGTQLEDPAGILLGGGKYRRHISFASPDELAEKEKPILRLLKQSARKSRTRH